MDSIHIKKMMMFQDEMDYVGSSIYLGNYKDVDENNIKIMVRIQIKIMLMMDQDDME